MMDDRDYKHTFAKNPSETLPDDPDRVRTYPP